jgi:nitrite reductase/ring-hydroxylating ferredoxin subunit
MVSELPENDTATDPLPGAIGTGAGVFAQIQGKGLPDLGRTRAALIAEPDSRPKNRRVGSGLAPRSHVLPVPNGWYSIMGGADLLEGDIVSIRAFDRELVVYRDAKGAAHVVDAYCPHMGAHLGGGLVVGCSLKCPYHGWEFGVDGRCVEIPYSDSRIPSRARVDSYAVREQDGFVYVWYHAAGTPPTYEIPRVEEDADPAWTEAHVWEFELVAALQEMAENNVDFAHFKYVHGRDIVPVGTSEHHFDGPRSWVEENLGEGLSFLRCSYGPGVAILRFTGLMTVVANTTPIDSGNCRLRWHFYFPLEVAGAADDLILSVVGPYGLQADVPIWRDMKFQERPVLVKGDGPIAEYRRWYAQFYEGTERELRPQ